MEAPASLLFLALYLLGDHRFGAVPLVLLGLWQLHYVQRAFVYPSLMRSGARMPVSVVAMAIAFNVLNAYVNARWISSFGSYDLSWLRDPRFLIGVALFIGGYAVNLTPIGSCAACVSRGRAAIGSRTVVCTAGCPAPITWARSSNGPAGPLLRGRWRGCRLRSTRSRISRRVPWRIMTGTHRRSTTIQSPGRHSCRFGCELWRGGATGSPASLRRRRRR